MNLMLYFAASTLMFAVAVEAVITIINPIVGTYAATSTSSISLSLRAAISINATEDYHAVFGIYPAGATVGSSYIGKRWHSIDLVAAGLSNTGSPSNITLSKLPLTSAYFPANISPPTPYILAMVVTTGTGTEIRTNYTVSIRTLLAPLNVTTEAVSID